MTDEMTPPGKGNRERHLELKGRLRCDYCAPGRGCNARSRREPRPDHYKGKRKGRE